MKKKRALLAYEIHVNERLFLHMPPPMPLVRYLFSKPVMVPLLILVGGYFVDRYFSDEKAIKINYIDFVGTCKSTQGIWEGRYSVAVPASSNHSFSAISAVRDSQESLSAIDKRTKIIVGKMSEFSECIDTARDQGRLTQLRVGRCEHIYEVPIKEFDSLQPPSLLIAEFPKEPIHASSRFKIEMFEHASEGLENTPSKIVFENHAECVFSRIGEKESR